MVKHAHNFIDLTGMRFGRLLVLAYKETKQDRRAIWECLCVCGNTKLVSSHDLNNGAIQSCGCFRKECYGKNRFIDRVDQRFGRLVVIEKQKIANHKTRWLCKCDCGKTKSIAGSDLVTGHASSCGCYQLERRTGENSYLWKGGVSKEPYNYAWNGTLKNQIRARDQYTCQLCGVRQSKEKLAVHHIDYDKQNINQHNLISLCRPCHTKTNHGREQWMMPLRYKSDYWGCFE